MIKLIIIYITINHIVPVIHTFLFAIKNANKDLDFINVSHIYLSRPLVDYSRPSLPATPDLGVPLECHSEQA